MAFSLLDLERVIAQIRRRIRLLELQGRGGSGGGGTGQDGRNPLTVSATEPPDPQIGDLWYQP